jgi:hypothetical protein
MERLFYYRRVLTLHKPPWKQKGLRYVALGEVGRRGRRYSGEPRRRGRPEAVGGWPEDLLGSVLAGVDAEERPAVVLAKVRRWRPPGDRLRRGGGSVGKVSKSVSYSRCKGRWRGPRLVMRPVRTWGSPRQPLMAPVEWLGPWNGRHARMPHDVPFIEALHPLCDAREEGGEGDRARAGKDGNRRSARAGTDARVRARSDTRRARTPMVLGPCAALRRLASGRRA